MDPSVKNPQALQQPGPYGEGDRVRLLWGVTPVEGIILEDRGNLGVGGDGYTASGFNWMRLPNPSTRPGQPMT